MEKLESTNLQKSPVDLWMVDETCDFTVVVNDATFKCHRSVLNASSEFFQGLFRSNMKECHENRVTVKDVSESTFEIILKSMYTRTALLTNDNVFNVWAAAIQFQVDFLIDECETFLINNMTRDTCFVVLDLTKFYESEKLRAASLKFIAIHFDKLKSSANLLQLPFEDFYSVVDNDYLATKSEECVLQTVFNWLHYDMTPERNSQGSVENVRETSSNIRNATDTNELRNAAGEVSQDHVANKTTESSSMNTTHNDDVTIKNEDRRQHSKELISGCRLCFRNMNRLSDKIKNKQLVMLLRDHIDLITDVLKCRFTKCRHNYWPKRKTKRLSSNMKHVVVFLSSGIFKAYDLTSGQLHDLVNIPQDARKVKCIKVIDNIIYVTFEDIYFSTNLSTYRQKWGWNTRLISFRIFAVKERDIILGYNKYLYRICKNGTSDSFSNIYRQHIILGGDLWSPMGTVEGDVDSVIVDQNYFLMFNNVSSQVNIYDTDTGYIYTSTIFGTCRDITGCCHHGDTYLLQRNGSMLKSVHPQSGPPTFELVSQLWDFDCDLKGCVLYQRQLFVFCDDDRRFKTNQHLTALPGIADNIKAVSIQSDSQCFLMIVEMGSRI